ncbi:MAG: hypothetical protein PHU21_02645 [Elusimicrobia bacterium]|jgi:hypothetical protein|nr:hypothetical protein [Elusimicrobiota bacterium]
MDIDDLSLEQLLDLNRRIVRRIEYLQGLKTRAHLDRFEVGDRVSFPSEGRQVEGVVVRVNQKTLSIRTKDTYWRIHPRFLTKLPGPKAELPQDVRAIIEPEKEP